MILGSLGILYRLALIFSAPARSAMIRRKIKNGGIDKNNAVDGLNYHDWFVLDMLGYNLTSSCFEYLLKIISRKVSGDDGHEG